MCLFLTKLLEGELESPSFKSNGLDKAVSINPIGKIKIGGVVLLQAEDKYGNTREDLYFSSELIHSRGLDLKINRSQDGKWQFKADSILGEKVALDRDIEINSLKKIYEYRLVRVDKNSEYMDHILPATYAGKNIFLVGDVFERNYFNEAGEKIPHTKKQYPPVSSSGFLGNYLPGNYVSYPILTNFSTNLSRNYRNEMEIANQKDFDSLSQLIWNDSKDIYYNSSWSITSGGVLQIRDRLSGYIGEIIFDLDKKYFDVSFSYGDKETMPKLFNVVVDQILKVQASGKQNKDTMPYVYELYDAMVLRGFNVEQNDKKQLVEKTIREIKLDWQNIISDKLTQRSPSSSSSVSKINSTPPTNRFLSDSSDIKGSDQKLINENMKKRKSSRRRR